MTNLMFMIAAVKKIVQSGKPPAITGITAS
jgi:hypothetical protein